MLELYKSRMSQQGSHMGEALRNQSNIIMNQTFDRDVSYKKCFMYGKPIDIKFMMKASYSIAKDQVEYLVQFRPGVRPEDETDGRLGMYIDIPDERNNYERWMIVAVDDQLQFPKYYVLKTNWTLKWIVDGTIYSQLGVLRSRNSYSSGIWTDYLTTTPESQNSIWVPTNEIVQKITYNQRFLISDNQINPMAWQASGFSDSFPKGITKIIFKQDLFNPAIDNADLMLANYYKSQLPPEPDDNSELIKSEGHITCKGQPVLKIGGSPKTLSGIFEDEEGNTIPIPAIKWTLTGLPDDSYQTVESGTEITISIKRDFSLIGKILHVVAENPLDDATACIDLEVTSL